MPMDTSVSWPCPVNVDIGSFPMSNDSIGSANGFFGTRYIVVFEIRYKAYLCHFQVFISTFSILRTKCFWYFKSRSIIWCICVDLCGIGYKGYHNYPLANPDKTKNSAF